MKTQKSITLSVFLLLLGCISTHAQSATSSPFEPSSSKSLTTQFQISAAQKSTAPTAKISKIDKDFVTAGANSDLESLKLLLSKGAHVNAVSDGQTALIGASLYGNVTLITYLLTHGANPNLHSDNAPTALTNAVESRSTNAINLLIHHGAKINEAGGSGETPLMRAIINNDYTMVGYLLKLGANPNFTPATGETPLVGAVSKNSMTIIRLLVDKGANINASGASGYSPLLIAAYYGNEPVIKYLLAKGASHNAQTTAGQTPLMLAISTGSLSSVKQFIAVGEPLTEHDAKGNTLLMNAAALASTKRRLEIFNTILKAGAPINATNNVGETAIMFACEYQNYEAAQALIDGGADPAITDANKVNATQYLAGAKSQSLIISEIKSPPASEISHEGARLLAGAILKHLSADDAANALLLSAMTGRIGTLDGCLDAGAPVDSANLADGKTALMIAAASGFNNIVNELIKHGASTIQTDQKGKTALDYAIAEGRASTVTLLQNAATTTTASATKAQN